MVPRLFVHSLNLTYYVKFIDWLRYEKIDFLKNCLLQYRGELRSWSCSLVRHFRKTYVQVFRVMARILFSLCVCSLLRPEMILDPIASQGVKDTIFVGVRDMGCSV